MNPIKSLVTYYEILLEQGKLEAPGWTQAKVSWKLTLNGDGQPVALMPLSKTISDGKKTKEVPLTLNVPVQVKKTVNVAANFLCDPPGYILGLNVKDDTEKAAKRTLECFEASRQRHLAILKGASSAAAEAVRRYYESWTPERAAESEIIRPHIDALSKGGSITFACEDGYVLDDPAIRAAWLADYARSDEQEETGQEATILCSVTGKSDQFARLHPALRGVQGAQSSGASLVSFNAPAYWSFGKENCENAPTGKYAAFAYGAALNYLLADRKHLVRIGDSTVVFWSESGDDESRCAMNFLMNGDDEALDDRLRDIMLKVAAGKPMDWDAVTIDRNERFYILALAPNAARLSIRFFLQDSFGNLIDNVRRHYDRLQIARPPFDAEKPLWPWMLLGETVNPDIPNKSPSPRMAGETLRAILNDTPYPASLFFGIEARLRANDALTWKKAAMIKAYILQNCKRSRHYNEYEEVLRKMALNETSTYPPHVLGRMFAVLEKIQLDAMKLDSPNKNDNVINVTIHDKYFVSACAMPQKIFPLLINKAQAHLRKLRNRQYSWYVADNKMLQDLLYLLTDRYPNHLNLEDQGIFQLAYYNQVRQFYLKKDTGESDAQNAKEEQNNG